MKEHTIHEKETGEKETGESVGKKKKRRAGIAIGLCLFLVCWMISWLPVTERISLDLNPSGDESVKIVLVTDLHSCYYGKEQEYLIRRIEKENPDLVIFSGDLFHDEPSYENALITIKRLAGMYPCYYVTGNHEFWSGQVEEMKAWVKEAGAIVLDGKSEKATIRGVSLAISGVDDPTDMSMDQWKAQLDNAYSQIQDEDVKILVSHRPEKTAVYEQYAYDLILTGHAHGGQFRIPFVNKGLYAPNQGLLAKYVSGSYELANGAIMVVSRGLARESIPLPRFFNRPQIVSIEIR